MGQPTITVASHFGDKEVTREEFISIWTTHVRELNRLDYDMEWLNQVRDIIEQVEEKAGQEFEAMFKRQHGTDLADYRGADYGED